MRAKTLGRFTVGAAVAGLVIAATCPASAADNRQFDTPEMAADALVIAVAARQQEKLKQILGKDWKTILPIENVDRGDVSRFLDGWVERHGVEYQGVDRAVLAVGRENWTLPVPIVKDTKGWRFDVLAGRKEILTRRIGRNELAAIKACLAYFDAQQEYALIDWNGDGVLEYAQRLISTPGQQDGLYWAALPEEDVSPLGPFFGTEEPGDDYHGYHFRILTAQGASAAGGAYDYRINGRIVSGFALVAWPSKFGETGIMSFQVSHEGVLYQKNLGPETDSLARAMTRFDPDETWQVVENP